MHKHKVLPDFNLYNYNVHKQYHMLSTYSD